MSLNYVGQAELTLKESGLITLKLKGDPDYIDSDIEEIFDELLDEGIDGELLDDDNDNEKDESEDEITRSFLLEDPNDSQEANKILRGVIIQLEYEIMN